MGATGTEAVRVRSRCPRPLARVPLVVHSTDRAVVLHTCGNFAYRVPYSWYAGTAVKYPYTVRSVGLSLVQFHRECHTTHVTRVRQRSDLCGRISRSEPRESASPERDTEYRSTPDSLLSLSLPPYPDSLHTQIYLNTHKQHNNNNKVQTRFHCTRAALPI